MKDLLGGKGANIAEMVSLKLPVPPGFTITTKVCTEFNRRGKKYPPGLKTQVAEAMTRLEKTSRKKFGNTQNPLLVSVRSGARVSMPGMMETVLNVGLTSKTIPGMIAKTNNPRFVWDAYRRLIGMYADVVMEKAENVDHEDGEGIRDRLEDLLNEVKEKNGYVNDVDLTAGDLEELCGKSRAKVREVLGKDFPDDPMEQLWGAVSAVFLSWNGKRALAYRRIENLPDDWGTAVNIMTMVFGNTGERSATGVAFTRNPATGAKKFYGEWRINAQGEDVVAGTRTPYALNEASKNFANRHLPTLENSMPRIYKQLVKIRGFLEKRYLEMQDIEFTIEDGKLYMLQTRKGKCNGPAAIKMAVDMVREKVIDKKTAVMRVGPEKVEELLHPMVDPKGEETAVKLCKGLPAGPGGGVGRIVLTADRALELGGKGEKVILVREETSPEDVHGMKPAQAILTSKGGMTSHAALVARGWGKCCIVGCGDMSIDFAARTVNFGEKTLKEGDWISMNGTKGIVYEGQIGLVETDPLEHKEFRTLMKWADEFRRLKIRTNADTPQDAATAVKFGAQGIGLTRTEHMFFGDRIWAVREMILAEDAEGRRKALKKLLPMQREDFIGIFQAMGSRPVTIRLLDPPLHEFLPKDGHSQEEMAGKLGVSLETVKAKVELLLEQNPMLGHRGCRLGVTYPEITRMQARAIFEAAAKCWKKKIRVRPEVMVPLVGSVTELANQRAVIDSVAKKVMEEQKMKFNYLVGTMIEVPRAALTADQIATEAQFFSFGTNDLTQMTFGFSRDDVVTFLPFYLESKILPGDPFASVDEDGVGELMKIGVEKGRKTRPDIKLGICGEHGGDPKS
ncbi:MAG: pyruvate, phosphate dikinase, partial [Pseudomonadota bacterium]